MNATDYRFAVDSAAGCSDTTDGLERVGAHEVRPMRIWLLLGLLAGLALAAGCATVTKTAQENNANVRSVLELDMREMADDWNMIWMADRQGRLTRWHMR